MNCHDNKRTLIDIALAIIVFILLILVFPKWVWYTLILAGITYCFYNIFKETICNFKRK